MRRRSTWDGNLAAAYLAGTALGATASALVVWLLSGLAEPISAGPRQALLAAGAVVAWGAKHGPLKGRVRLPEVRRQIPADIFGGDLVRGAFRFGAELGTGVRTYAPAAAPYVLVLALLLARVELVTAVAAGVGFGSGRAVPIVAMAVVADRGAVLGASQRAVGVLGASVSTVLVAAGGLTLA